MVGPCSNNKPWDYSDPDCSMHIDKKHSAVVRGEREGIWGVRGGVGGGWRLGKEGRERWAVLWMDRVFDPPNTLNSLSQAAAAVCGMRGAGWELLDSWILEACGLISRTKPTQWGGADMPPPPNWNFLPAREEAAQSLYWLATAVKEFADYVWGFLSWCWRLCFCTISFVLALWKEFPHLNSLLLVV